MDNAGSGPGMWLQIFLRISLLLVVERGLTCLCNLRGTRADLSILAQQTILI